MIGQTNQCGRELQGKTEKAKKEQEKNKQKNMLLHLHEYLLIYTQMRIWRSHFKKLWAGLFAKYVRYYIIHIILATSTKKNKI